MPLIEIVEGRSEAVSAPSELPTGCDAVRKRITERVCRGCIAVIAGDVRSGLCEAGREGAVGREDSRRIEDAPSAAQRRLRSQLVGNPMRGPNLVFEGLQQAGVPFFPAYITAPIGTMPVTLEASGFTAV